MNGFSSSWDCLLRENENKSEVSGLPDGDWLDSNEERDREVPKRLATTHYRLKGLLLGS
jgi:hypothetical protein